MEPDEDLVRRLAAGSNEALAGLLRRYERALSAFLFRRTGGRDVEDLYQETWMRVIRHADRFDPAQRFSTWLFQIALNLCRDWQRRQPPQAELVPESTGAIASVSSRVEAGIDAARLLARLPEEQREVVILRYYHDLPESQVAQILGVPLGTVKSRMHNAVKAMSTTISGDGK